MVRNSTTNELASRITPMAEPSDQSSKVIMKL
jgi:hypothetical protein